MALNQDKNVIQFVSFCDELIDCNFLVAESKMQKIMAALADTKPVYDLIADCLEHFNREREMVKAFTEVAPGRFAYHIP